VRSRAATAGVSDEGGMAAKKTKRGGPLSALRVAQATPPAGRRDR